MLFPQPCLLPGSLQLHIMSIETRSGSAVEDERYRVWVGGAALCWQKHAWRSLLANTCVYDPCLYMVPLTLGCDYRRGLIIDGRQVRMGLHGWWWKCWQGMQRSLLVYYNTMDQADAVRMKCKCEFANIIIVELCTCKLLLCPKSGSWT